MTAIVSNDPQPSPHDSLGKPIRVDHRVVRNVRLTHELGMKQIVKTAEQDSGVSQVSGEIEEGPEEVWPEAIVGDDISKLLDADFFIEMLCKEIALANSSIVIISIMMGFEYLLLRLPIQ